MSAQYISGSSIRDNGQAPALALERQAIGTDDENQQLEHALLHTSTSGDGDTLDHHTPEENEHDDANDNDHSSKSDNDDEFAEEDAWLVAGHFLSDDDDDNDNDSERYVPQLMDTREMCELRSTLRKSERQIATCGRLREFVPRKPAASPEHRGGKRVVSAAPSTAAIGAQDVPQSARRSRKQEDFAVVLRRELRQLRELELRYDETKRLLLEQMDVVCSLKPSERTGGRPEAYDKLAELLAFAAQCHASHHEQH